MMQVNVLEAKTGLSKLLRILESNREEEIRIARNGKPIAKLVSIDKPPVSNRIGVAKGKFRAPDDFDADNEKIARMMIGGDL